MIFGDWKKEYEQVVQSEDCMTIIGWDNSFSVGVRKIDQHNQLLLELINNLYIELVKHPQKEQTKLDFHHLLDYIFFHFACEEIWMHQTKDKFVTYNHNQHQVEHKQLCQRLLEIHAAYQYNHIIGRRQIPLLAKSILAHIKLHDSAYAHFIEGKK
jgi:hemerythrin